MYSIYLTKSQQGRVWGGMKYTGLKRYTTVQDGIARLLNSSGLRAKKKSETSFLLSRGIILQTLVSHGFSSSFCYVAVSHFVGNILFCVLYGLLLYYFLQIFWKDTSDLFLFLLNFDPWVLSYSESSSKKQ